MWRTRKLESMWTYALFFHDLAKCILGVSGYSLFMNRKRMKDVVLKSLFAIVLAMLFISLLAQRLFHPR